MSPSLEEKAHAASVDFLLARQEHCDRSLSRLAEPNGRSVLVVGAGVGTEVLWALEHGAAEVVGIDPEHQSTAALDEALRRRGLEDRADRYTIHRMGIEEAPRLDRRFDLVLSYNVFEHLPDLEGAFSACARLVKPGAGRVAVFTDPLFYSSTGSHLEHEPWEHLWGDPAELAERLRPALPEWHALHWTDIDGFYDEIGLNRMRLDGVFGAVRASGLVPLRFATVRDRNLDRLAEYLPRLAGIMEEIGLGVGDLAVEGLECELALVEPGAGAPASFESVRERLVRSREKGWLRRFFDALRGR